MDISDAAKIIYGLRNGGCTINKLLADCCCDNEWLIPS